MPETVQKASRDTDETDSKKECPKFMKHIPTSSPQIAIGDDNIDIPLNQSSVSGPEVRSFQSESPEAKLYEDIQIDYEPITNLPLKSFKLYKYTYEHFKIVLQVKESKELRVLTIKGCPPELTEKSKFWSGSNLIEMTEE